jgi:S1-C subfamily serine protease
MISRSIVCVFTLGFLVATTSIGGVASADEAASAPAASERFELSLSHMRLREAAQVISDLTGKGFSVPSAITDSQVNLICKRKLTRGEAYSLFVLALAAQGIRVSRGNVHALMKETFGKGAQPLPDVEDVDARIVPALIDKEPSGFFIYNIRPDSLFDRAGLRDGDVVREANGKPLDVESGPCALVDALTSAQPLALGIERKQRMTLSISPNP